MGVRDVMFVRHDDENTRSIVATVDDMGCVLTTIETLTYLLELSGYKPVRAAKTTNDTQVTKF
jgi:hypothetical protein